MPPATARAGCWRSCFPAATSTTAPGSPKRWTRSGYHTRDQADPAVGLIPSWPTRATRRARSAPGYASATSATPSPNALTRSLAASAADAAVDARPPSTSSSTRRAAPWPTICRRAVGWPGCSDQAGPVSWPRYAPRPRRHNWPSRSISLGTVSAHLATLRQAGVVTRQRTGRSVYYERTPLGDELVGLITGAVGSPVRR